MMTQNTNTTQDMKTDINALAQQHWCYIKELLNTCMPLDCYSKAEVIEMIGYNYKSAMIHGWKHRAEIEDLEEIEEENNKI